MQKQKVASKIALLALSIALVSCGAPFELSGNLSAGKSESKSSENTAQVPNGTNNNNGLPAMPVVAPRLTNQKPIIHSISANPTNVAANKDDKITFTVVATDPDGDNLSYSWSATKGTLSSTGGQVTSWSPLRGDGKLEPGTATISVIIHDGKDVTNSAVNIQIEAEGIRVDSNSQSQNLETPEIKKELETLRKQLGSQQQAGPVGPGQPPTSTAPNSGTSTPIVGTTPIPTNTQVPVPTPTPSPTIIFGCYGEYIEIPYGQPIPSYSCPPTTPSQTPTVSSSPTASSLPSATDDISVVEKTTFNGEVFDDTQAPLDGVSIYANSLNSSVPYSASSTTAGGNYAFNNAPAGVQIEIIATRPGFTARRHIVVLKSNKQGDPNANKYDFGVGTSAGTGSSANALSDKPEVTMVTPGRNASGIDSATSFILKFSEPMDRATVRDSFLIRAYTSEQLSVDSGETFNGSNAINFQSGSQVWDKAAFNVSWNSDDTEATFSFKEERKLPTDKDSDKVPDYQVTFSSLGSNPIKDKSGISRTSNYFKLTDGNFEQTYKFAIKTDEQKPSLSSLVAQTAENAGQDGDALKVRFSERMAYYTLEKTISGGMNGTASQAAGSNNGVSAQNAACNYLIEVNRAGTPILNSNWCSLGGRAVFDTNDPTHKTVLLLPPSSQTDLYKPGDNVKITVSTSVLDPAGNSINPSNSDASANAS